VHGQITGEEDEIAGGSPPRKANHRGIAGRLPHYPSLHGTMRNEVGDGGGLPKRTIGPTQACGAAARYPPTVGSGWYSLLCEASLTHCPPL